MRSLVVLVVLAGSLADLVILTVPADHGRVALAGQVGERKVECLISQINDNWPRRIFGPWAINQTAGDDRNTEYQRLRNIILRLTRIQAHRCFDVGGR